MKTTIILLSVAAFLIVGSIISGFPSNNTTANPSKVETAEINLNIANDEASDAHIQTLKEEDLSIMIMESELTLKDNEININKLKKKIAKQDTDYDEIYQQKIEKLEMKNLKLNKSISEYKNHQTGWERTKREVNQHIIDLDFSLKKFLFKNRKTYT
ncbi:MAG: hypothetical protein ACOYMD_11210, partial [Paludibacter sp.]